MTAIVAISEKGKVWIGGDSAGVGGLSLTIRKDEKVFINGNFIFGFTSSFRMGQLLHFSFKPPVQPAKMSNEKFMVTRFVDSVRMCFKSGGYLTNEKGQEEGGTFLVGYKGQIYEIHNDFQVAIPIDNFSAVGCGSDLCVGSLCSTKGPPVERIDIALKAAERYSAGCRGPFIVKYL